MNANWKKSISSAAALIVLGVAALYGGPKLLALIIPVGMVVWYGTATTVRSGRN
jgi:ABC-type dipeptide/oligopeptide/nickel transport system permease subunit